MSLRTLAASLFLALASAAAQAGPVEDMAAFERVYIPALALTNQPQAPAERVAGSLSRLAASWPGLRAAFSGKDEPLEKALRITDTALAQAGQLLAQGKRAEAHEALEAIRPAFLQARRAAGIDLYVDRLTEFHDAMEELVKAAQAGAPVFFYRFDWETPEGGGHMRSPHTVEIPFVFSNIAIAGPLISKMPEAYDLAKKVSASWVAFARTGDPSVAGLPKWPAYSATTRDTMLFNNASRVEKDPDRGPRLAMEKLLKL